MFEKKRSIIFITKSKLKITRVTLGKNPKETLIVEADWAEKSLSDILSKLKKNIGNSASILLSEDFVYVVSLSMPQGLKLTRNAVMQKAQELIPQDLNSTSWDFKETPNGKIQVAAFVKDFYESLSVSIAKSGLRVKTIEPLSFSLARLTKKEEDPILFVYIYNRAFLILVKKELVLSTERLALPVTKDRINTFIAFTKEQLGIEPKKIIFCGNTENINPKEYESQNLKARIQDISPTINSAYKEDIKGKDSETLSLTLKSISTSNQPVDDSKPLRKSNFKWILIICLIVIFILGILGGLFFLRSMNSKKIDESQKVSSGSATTSQTPVSPSQGGPASPSASQNRDEPTPSSAQLDISAYAIAVLNGNGIEGSATIVEDLLKDSGFNVVRVGNADNYDYERTEIKAKETIPNEVLVSLDKILKANYDSFIGQELPETEDSDILIIVGKTK